MTRWALVAALLAAAPAWAHHGPLHVDLVCSAAADGLSALALGPFFLLAAVGVMRALARHRKDR